MTHDFHDAGIAHWQERLVVNQREVRGSARFDSTFRPHPPYGRAA